MNKFSKQIYLQKNETFSDTTQENRNNTEKEKNTETLHIKNNDIESKDHEVHQNLNSDKNKSLKSLKNNSLSLFEKLRNEGFTFLEDENEEILSNIFIDDLKLTEDEKMSESEEKSTNDEIKVDQQNSDFLTNMLFFSSDESEEKKITDCSDEEEKNTKNHIKLFNNEEININHLINDWENYNFSEQLYSVNDKQTQKQLINNLNNNNNQNNCTQNKWGLNSNFPVNTNIINQNIFINNFQNFNNYNCFKNSPIHNNPMKKNQIFRNQYNNQFNNPKNRYSKNLKSKNITNSNNQNTTFQNFNFAEFQNFENNNISNPKKKHEKKDIDKNNLIDINNIKLGLEKRTTVRMMNIPPHYTASNLAWAINKNLGINPKKENRTYNYIYVPRTMRNGSKNTGFAFINFVDPKHIIKFYEYYENRNLRTEKSKKICHITFADKQKIENDSSNDINPNGNYLIFNDTKNHYLLLDE